MSHPLPTHTPLAAPSAARATPAAPLPTPRPPLARSTLSRPSRHLLALYLTSLLALALVGAQNQRAHLRHESLLTQKQTLQTRLQGLRLEAAGVSGALAVRRWALQQGMVPAPESLNRTSVETTPAPTYTAPTEGLEMYTVWR